PSLSSRAARLTIRSLFDSLGSIGPLEDPVHEDARRDHVVRIDLARLDQLLDLDERHVPRGRGHRVEVSRGHSVDEIPHRVAFQAFTNAKSPRIGISSTYSCPLRTRVSLP